MLSDLSNQERTFAEQNKILINQIIDIAKRIFRGHDHEPSVPAYETREPYSALQRLIGWADGNSRDSDVNPLDEMDLPKTHSVRPQIFKIICKYHLLSR